MCLKNWWSNRTLMTKGGIIASLVYILPTIYAVIYLMYFNGMQKSTLWPLFIYFPSAFITAFFITNPFWFFISCIVANILIYYLVGALIGKIITLIRLKKLKNIKLESFKKIKSRKKKL